MLITGLAFTVRAVLKAGSRAVTRITFQKLPVRNRGGGGNSHFPKSPNHRFRRQPIPPSNFATMAKLRRNCL